MRDYLKEIAARVQFIQDVLKKTNRNGIVFANSGGKDCALVGVLCKKACADTVSLVLPCSVKRNYEEDKNDALKLCTQFGIENRVVDLKPAYDAMVAEITKKSNLSDEATRNIAPRLRMQTLYAISNSEGRLVAGTGNRSEIFLGYFTKWGDGAYDFNPIADLTVTEIYGFLKELHVPKSIIEKPPSAGLYEGQTDEADLGFTYEELDRFLLFGEASEENRRKFMTRHNATENKRRLPLVYEAVQRG